VRCWCALRGDRARAGRLREPRPLLWTAVGLAAMAAVAAAALGSARVDSPSGRAPPAASPRPAQVYPRLGGDGFEYFGVARLAAAGPRPRPQTTTRAWAPGRSSPLGQVTARTPLGLSLLWMPVIAVAHVATLAAPRWAPAFPRTGSPRRMWPR
jgi:hypothetical protein